MYNLKTNTMANNEILIHNIAGELSSLYVNYLAKHAIRPSHDYYKKNWASEYKSRVNQMTKDSSLISKLNGFNAFYKQEINQGSEVKRKFLFQS